MKKQILHVIHPELQNTVSKYEIKGFYKDDFWEIYVEFPDWGLVDLREEYKNWNNKYIEVEIIESNNTKTFKIIWDIIFSDRWNWISANMKNYRV